MVGLCFHPLDIRFLAFLTYLQIKANLCLHSSARGIEINTLVMSLVAYLLAAFDSSLCWSSRIPGAAALSGDVTSFRKQ